MSEIHRSRSATLAPILAFALADSRRSAVSHHTHACVSSRVGIALPLLARTKWIAHFLEHAAGEASLFRGFDIRNQLGHGAAALGDHHRRLAAGDLVERLQTDILELPRRDLHSDIIAIAIWPCP